MFTVVLKIRLLGEISYISVKMQSEKSKKKWRDPFSREYNSNATIFWNLHLGLRLKSWKYLAEQVEVGQMLE